MAQVVMSVRTPLGTAVLAEADAAIRQQKSIGQTEKLKPMRVVAPAAHPVWAAPANSARRFRISWLIVREPKYSTAASSSESTGTISIAC